MAIDWIPITTTVGGVSLDQAQKLKRYVGLARELRDLGVQIAGVMSHNATDPDYTPIETYFGVPSGQGDETYNLFTGAHARVNHADVVALIDRVG